MKKLTLLFIGLIMLLGTTAATNDKNTMPYFMLDAATEFNIDPGLLYAICTKESKCRVGAINQDDATKKEKALGKKSASHGMFQIKLATARALGFHGTTKELRKPEINTWYAAKYLRHLYDRYGDTTKVISSYNAGHYTKANKEYVFDVLSNYIKYKIDKRI